MKMRKVCLKNEFLALLAGIILALFAGSCSLALISLAVYDIEKTNNCTGAIYPNPSLSPYILPFEVGTERFLSQSCCDGLHNDRDWFAYDFDMPIGTPVMAAREGVVTWIQERYENGNDDKYQPNTIQITHVDGTFARYLHLKENSFLVQIGEKVEQGQAIGSSGSAGRKGPRKHLHFVVLDNLDAQKRNTLPVTFKNVEAKQPLSAGRSYRAHP